MSHSPTKIWIHTVFGTKNDKPEIVPELEPTLHKHIKTQMEQDFDCRIRVINGTKDHLHILFLLNPNYSIADILKNIKGESSHWWNQNDFTEEKFAWQTGYGAFSVSESIVKNVELYIRNQKQHHKIYQTKMLSSTVYQ